MGEGRPNSESSSADFDQSLATVDQNWGALSPRICKPPCSAVFCGLTALQGEDPCSCRRASSCVELRDRKLFLAVSALLGEAAIIAQCCSSGLGVGATAVVSRHRGGAPQRENCPWYRRRAKDPLITSGMLLRASHAACRSYVSEVRSSSLNMECGGLLCSPESVVASFTSHNSVPLRKCVHTSRSRKLGGSETARRRRQQPSPLASTCFQPPMSLPGPANTAARGAVEAQAGLPCEGLHEDDEEHDPEEDPPVACSGCRRHQADEGMCCAGASVRDVMWTPQVRKEPPPRSLLLGLVTGCAGHDLPNIGRILVWSPRRR